MIRFIILVLISLNGIVLSSSNDDSNVPGVCIKKERYVELERIKVIQPVKIRTSRWCFSLPPRCTVYQTSLKEIVKLQNVTKTRLMSHCCEGYEQISLNESEGSVSLDFNNNSVVKKLSFTCQPICSDCQNGKCTSPGQCKCDAGYEGQQCNQTCEGEMWGDNCENFCKCRNNAKCDTKTGMCHCSSGYAGTFCEHLCQKGYYGNECKTECICSTKKCHHITGACANDTRQNLFHKGKIDSMNNTNTTRQRIKAQHWIPVIGNGQLNIKNCTETICTTDTSKSTLEHAKYNQTNSIATAKSNTTALSERNHLALNTLIGKTHEHHEQLQNNSIIIKSLNSTIANLTDNIGKLSKQLNEQQLALKLEKEVQNENDHGIVRIANISQFNITDNNSHSDDAQPLAILVDLTASTTTQKPAKAVAAILLSTNNKADLVQPLAIQKLGNLITLNGDNESDDGKQAAAAIIDSTNPINAIPIPIRSKILIQNPNGDDAIVDEAIDKKDKNNEIVHVITSIDNDVVAQSNNNATKIEIHQIENGNHFLFSTLIFLLIMFFVIFIVFVVAIFVKRSSLFSTHNDAKRNQSQTAQNNAPGIVQKPLPDIPLFTKSVTVHPYSEQLTAPAPVFQYSYTTSADVSNNQPRSNRNVDHIYDEINYPAWKGENQKTIT